MWGKPADLLLIAYLDPFVLQEREVLTGKVFGSEPVSVGPGSGGGEGMAGAGFLSGCNPHQPWGCPGYG